MRVILFIMSVMGSVDLDQVSWHKLPRIMRKDIRRYYKLENKEIRNNERIQKKYDRLYDEQSTSRPSEGFGVSRPPA